MYLYYSNYKLRRFQKITTSLVSVHLISVQMKLILGVEHSAALRTIVLETVRKVH